MGVFSHSPRLMARRRPRPDPAPETMHCGSAPTTPQQPLHRQFHLFSLLPPELRLRIWNLNLPSCRLVPLHCDTASPSLYENSAPSSHCATGCTSNAPVPVNLHVCAESRAEAFKSYSRAFGFARGPGHVIFNPDSDILLFGPRKGYMAAGSQFHTCMSMCDQAELARVRRVAISDGIFWIDGTYRSMTAASPTVEVIKQLAARMHSLERIIFVPREEDETGDLAVAMERMARQIQMALATVCQQVPLWRPPPWDIVSTSSLSTMGD
ncbi:hypothetical protein HRG_008737 [Hirsutella rhossiliensis]|uniref:2EXR domain-containing protein n=1 Tax=Hirsutella rhossiliensis TaxID=111463 RepID=A0A9P8MWR5_9HYPO|nr:uncharacterized protein HRG_08737 [Hirsutella rhossiliensis]KAH0960582.1 hypothetical protein HRG_08737 [Hirsutella rhossiliensis]